MIWFFTGLILFFLLFQFRGELNWAVEALIWFWLPFNFVWFPNVVSDKEDVPRPPVKQWLLRTALAFAIGMGVLLSLRELSIATLGIAQISGVPEVPAQLLATSGAFGAVLLQFGVGIIEEGTFRVALPRLLLSTRIRQWTAVTASSFVFGLFHWSAYRGDVKALIVAIAVGFLQAIALALTKSPTGIMLGHAVWNLMVSNLLTGVLYWLVWITFAIGVLYLVQIKLKERGFKF
jgi:hypothetical protein